jgi:hypothetical protein
MFNIVMIVMVLAKLVRAKIRKIALRVLIEFFGIDFNAYSIVLRVRFII